MEYLSFDPKSKKLTLEECAVPSPSEKEVLIKVSHSGICGTDLHILDGAFPCKDGPLILGHEFSGLVQAVGSAVTAFKVGQKVVADPNTGCNTCDFCHGGNYHFCRLGGVHNTIGIFRDGGWATHVLVPDSQVHLVPEGVKLPQAALVEPLSCLVHGWDILNPVHVGTRILIIGAGIIGSLWSCLLHLYGQRKTVTISEPQVKRRRLFENLDLGFKTVAPEDLKGSEFDLAIDCSGSGPAMQEALTLLGRGGRLCVFGVANPNTEVKFKPFEVYARELAIVGVNINPFTFPKALSLITAMTDTYLDYEKLGIGVYSLKQYQEALTALRNGDISKVVFKF
ncbi:D-arabinitol dehydrogenase 1-like [Neodiprion virginianus]|uniref:D-arabinitol dehydrogenase 1-like n=1 Tax=Neodiprion fabricii TaxID=2872261 RepID=UPI001ED900FD|nr:D-arabinitol dehydrogenase 1-like [Neodiprion fabricii]XP_046423853.1 D-arabinitol dehydrogenase 1-like [Neodiprion fabricii]XP_046423854.1 D-arabinitol dehydrogenase 1-like [Neodiprion fabricii]XP_046423855.1 D-arabinitol dehydrogenase 1-like [Neodiprion fabricii]XP_046617009.1 D-arabinitol dehydrogenase 1-like [Neodiprion virginianus]XP_046617010.1 D-arabinitol dehydrogenase 1-like [Neodiprion virginianus]XP_046617012.1 D-arabinitol dehydrogenase 1-like [Neodiprion virginianus]XP_046617